MLTTECKEAKLRKLPIVADPQAIADNDNVFGLLPVNTGLKIAVWLMVIHQVHPLWSQELCKTRAKFSC